MAATGAAMTMWTAQEHIDRPHKKKAGLKPAFEKSVNVD
jgi:hypothetical protein